MASVGGCSAMNMTEQVTELKCTEPFPQCKASTWEAFFYEPPVYVSKWKHESRWLSALAGKAWLRGSYCSTSAWMRHLWRTLASWSLRSKINLSGSKHPLVGFLMDKSKTKDIRYPLTAAAFIIFLRMWTSPCWLVILLGRKVWRFMNVQLTTVYSLIFCGKKLFAGNSAIGRFFS